MKSQLTEKGMRWYNFRGSTTFLKSKKKKKIFFLDNDENLKKI